MSDLLFVEKVFLRPASSKYRGVELFNFNLLRELRELGYHIHLPVERSWAPLATEELGTDGVTVMALPNLGIPAISAGTGALTISRGTADWLVMGNVGRGIIPMVRLMHRRGCFSRSLVIAHREADERFVRLCRDLKTTVVAVNTIIAQRFTDGACAPVATDYGITNAREFFPAEPEERNEVRFGVLGALDSAWKGADQAVAAFKALPNAVKARCRLELASYAEPVDHGDPNIIAHTWQPPDWIPGWLRSLDVLMVPSYDEEVMRETFSQAMVQGMLTGLPTIVNDLPVLVEKLDQGGGIVCRNVGEYTAAMERLAGDSELRREMGGIARTVALERYVWDTARFVERYL